MHRCLLAVSLCLAPVAACGPPAPRAHRPVPPKSPPGRAHAARAPRPVRVLVPRIGVDAPLVRLGLDARGALEVPRGFREAGWWTGGPRPGERGPAVIAGHVDSRTGPAVFFRLALLRAGDVVVVRRRDGSRIRFTVRRVAHYPKARFPTTRVYGPTSRPELRLITCSGAFDHATGHYLDNTVVYAAA
jgi:sortase (surface protein transpeptidase)